MLAAVPLVLAMLLSWWSVLKFGRGRTGESHRAKADAARKYDADDVDGTDGRHAGVTRPLTAGSEFSPPDSPALMPQEGEADHTLDPSVAAGLSSLELLLTHELRAAYDPKVIAGLVTDTEGSTEGGRPKQPEKEFALAACDTLEIPHGAVAAVKAEPAWPQLAFRSQQELPSSRPALLSRMAEQEIDAYLGQESGRLVASLHSKLGLSEPAPLSVPAMPSAMGAESGREHTAYAREKGIGAVPNNRHGISPSHGTTESAQPQSVPATQVADEMDEETNWLLYQKFICSSSTTGTHAVE